MQSESQTTTANSTSGGGWLPTVMSTVRSWWNGFSAIDQPVPPSAAHDHRSKRRICVICQERIFGEPVLVPCGHYYGVSCLLDLVLASTRDGSLFPPRCCRVSIPLESLRPQMGAELSKLVDSKYTEFETLKRVYCSNPACSRLLGPQAPGLSSDSTLMKSSEPTCQTFTCFRCGGATYPGSSHSCRDGPGTQAVLALGARCGWARYPELDTGPRWGDSHSHRAAEVHVEAALRQAQIVPVAPAPVARLPTPAPTAKLDCVEYWRMLGTQSRSGSTVSYPQAGASSSHRIIEELPPPYSEVVSLGCDARTVHSRTSGKASALTSRPCRLTPHASSNPRTSRATYEAWTSPGRSQKRSWTQLLETNENGPRSYSHPSAFVSSSKLSGQISEAGNASKHTGCHSSQAGHRKARSKATPEREQLVKTAIEDLQENRKCTHKHWVYHHGGGICEHCQRHLPLYLFSCPNCNMYICNHCRRNRL